MILSLLPVVSVCCIHTDYFSTLSTCVFYLLDLVHIQRVNNLSLDTKCPTTSLLSCTKVPPTPSTSFETAIGNTVAGAARTMSEPGTSKIIATTMNGMASLGLFWCPRMLARKVRFSSIHPFFVFTLSTEQHLSSCSQQPSPRKTTVVCDDHPSHLSNAMSGLPPSTPPPNLSQAHSMTSNSASANILTRKFDILTI